MSCVLSASRLLATLAFVGFAGAAFAADPPPHPVPLADAAKKPAPSCGGLPRGGRAFKDCIAAQSRRDTVPGSQQAAKPASSSR
jgi:hypothetical protein